MEAAGGLSLERRVRQLERRLRFSQIGSIIGILSFAAFAFSRVGASQVLADDSQKILASSWSHYRR